MQYLSVTLFPFFLNGAIMKNRLTAPQHFAWLGDIVLLGGLGLGD